MLGKLKDLLGMGTGENTEALSYREQRQRARKERLARAETESPSRFPLRADDLPPFEPEEQQDERITLSIHGPERTVADNLPMLVMVRGDNCIDMCDDLIMALEDGQSILLELTGAEPVGAQEALDDLVVVARELGGHVYRISGTTFLLCPARGMVEEWVAELEEPHVR